MKKDSSIRESNYKDLAVSYDAKFIHYENKFRNKIIRMLAFIEKMFKKSVLIWFQFTEFILYALLILH